MTANRKRGSMRDDSYKQALLEVLSEVMA